jgi:hypothetical protein
MAQPKTNWLFLIYDTNGNLVDIPQADILSFQLTDAINGGSGAGGGDQIVFARPYNKIGAVGFLYSVLFWFWPTGTTRPTNPYWAGYVVDFDQTEEDASGQVTAYLYGDFKRLDAAIVSEQINPGVSGNPTLDAAAYITHLLSTYQPATFGAPTIPASMFQLLAMQFDASMLGATVDTVTKTGRDTSGLFYTWRVNTTAGLARSVVVQSDQNPNVISGINFKMLFRGSQIREYKIQTKYRDIYNVVTVYGGKDPGTGAQAWGSYQDPTSVSQFGPWQTKLSVPALISNAACQAYATVYFPLHAYPQAQSNFKVLVPDNTIVGGTWVQINEVPATSGASAVYKQVRASLVQISMDNQRLVQYIETVAPVPYLDDAVYVLGLNIAASMVTATKGLSQNRQTLYVRAGGTVSSSAVSPARVALTATEAIFPGSNSITLVKAAALPLTVLSSGHLTTETGIGITTEDGLDLAGGQAADGAFTISLTSNGEYVITSGARPAETATQLNLVSAVVLSVSAPQDTLLLTDIRTLVALPTLDTTVAPTLAAAGGGTISPNPQIPTPGNAGSGAYDQPVTFQLSSTWTLANPSLAYIELGWAATGNVPAVATKCDPTASGVYSGVVPGIGAGQSVTIYMRAVDTNDRPTPWLGLGVTAVNPLGVGATNFGSHPVPTVSASTLAAGTAQNSVHAQVNATVSLTGVPIDGSVSGVAFYYRLHGTTQIKPIGEYQLVQGSATQTVPASGVFGFEVGAGQNIDVFVGYVGVASSDYGPLVQIGSSAQISSGFTPASLVITTPYLANGAVVAAPTVTGPTGTGSPTFTAIPSANGISAGVTIAWEITNQGTITDNSLYEITLERRVTGSGSAFEKYVDIPALAGGVYSYPALDLSNGQGYDWQARFRSTQGQTSAATSLGSSSAATVIIGNPAHQAGPAGATFTVSSATASIQDAGSPTGTAGTNPVIAVTLTISESNTPAMANWSVGFIANSRTHSATSLTDATTYQPVPIQQYSVGNGSVLKFVIPISVRSNTDIGLQIVDGQGNIFPSATTLVQVASGVSNLRYALATLVGYSSGATVDSLEPAQAGADVTGSNTSNDTSKVNGVASSSISPIASLMPAAAGADVTANNYSAGVTHSGTSISAQSFTADVADLGSGSGISFKRSSSQNAQGSIVPSAGITTVPSYTSTSSSLTLTIPSYAFKRADGGTWTTPSTTPAAFGSLSPSTTYHFNVWYNIVANTVSVILYGTSALTPAQRAACVADGQLPIYIDYSAVTPASGSGSGGGGSGGGGGMQCPAVHQMIETRERGFIRADELRVGDHLRDSFDGWNAIERLATLPTIVYRLTTDDESVDVNDTHAVLDLRGFWRPITQLAIGTELAPLPGEAPPVVRAVERIGPGEYVAIMCERHRYVLGRHLAHNITF